MAAPTLSVDEQQASLRANLPKAGKTKQTIKHVLMPPYKTAWPALDAATESSISEKLKEYFQKFDLPKTKGGLKRKQLENKEVQQRKKLLRSHVVFGINSVTKALEKDLLQLVITCASANPPILTKHLIGLSETRKCLAICISNLNKILTDTINIGSIAIGFNKLTNDSDTDDKDLQELVSFVNDIVSKSFPESTCNAEHQRESEKNLENKKESEEKSENNSNVSQQVELNSANTKIKDNNSDPTDYTKFYVFKKDLPEDKMTLSFHAEFVALCESSVSKNRDSHMSPELVKKKKQEHVGNDTASDYITIDVQKMKPNEKKKKKKKIGKNKITNKSKKD